MIIPIPKPLDIKALVDKRLVIEELLDAPAVALSFDDTANITIELLDDADAKHYEQLYTWTEKNASLIFDLLLDRYVMIGRWCANKKTIYYDNLCGFFIENDIFDKEKERWLSTTQRHSLILKHAPKLICSAPVCKIGKLVSKDEIKEWATFVSFNKTDVWKDKLQEYCDKNKLCFDDVMNETDNTSLMRGLLIKHEDETSVVDRYIYTRPDFVEKVGSFVVPNLVADV